MKNAESLLKIRNLKTYFFTDAGVVKAVNGLSLDISPGKTLGLVGESGCGKSVTALSILGLVPSPPGKIVQGTIEFKGQDLLRLKEKELRAIRGKDISMIFQEPMTSLNPVFTVGEQIREALRTHQRISKQKAQARTLELLELVKLSAPEKRARSYPHELSGGMRQRVMIAMALSCSPSLLVADEPTTALDVTIQAQILSLLADLQKKLSMSLLLITHDLGVIAQRADEVAVMYAGNIVERAPVRELFARPRHPYTQGLLKCLPRLDQKQDKLPVIKGQVPDLVNLPEECSFCPRCLNSEKQCSEKQPQLEEIKAGHWVACWKKNGSNNA